MLTNPFSSSFLDLYNLSMSSFACKALCIGISFLALINLSEFFSARSLKLSLPSILQQKLSWSLFRCWDFCWRLWFREVFLFFWGTLFKKFFFHLYLVYVVLFRNSPPLVIFFFFTKCSLFNLASLFNGISTFVGYLMSKPSFFKNSSGII